MGFGYLGQEAGQLFTRRLAFHIYRYTAVRMGHDIGRPRWLATICFRRWSRLASGSRKNTWKIRPRTAGPLPPLLPDERGRFMGLYANRAIAPNEQLAYRSRFLLRKLGQ